MKTSPALAISTLAALSLVACNPSENKTGSEVTKPETIGAVLPDIPLLPVTKGDNWIYDVHLEIPPDTTSPGAAEIDEHHRRVRTYIGKIIPAEGLPEVDCFEVSAPAAPVEREFVDIQDDKIMMRGSMLMRPETTKPMWMNHAVPFVFAGMKPGTESPEVEVAGGALSRKTQVVAREDITVPAGTFPSIRLLMTGMDGDLELRRSIWFAPGIGIVREEKARYRKDKLIFRETQELKETSVKRKK